MKSEYKLYYNAVSSPGLPLWLCDYSRGPGQTAQVRTELIYLFLICCYFLLNILFKSNTIE